MNKIQKNEPLVSICCITYNHEKYIRKCIEGFLIQKTSFPIEIIMHDDASTDRTPQIIQEYINKYPDLITPIFQKENHFSKGKKIFANYVLPRARGKYIALCEGDDYWTDPLKLQKQIDFLEANPDYIMCYHNAKIIDENENIIKNSKLTDDLKKDFSKEELIKGKMILTLTLCFRNILKELPFEYYQVYNGDKFLTSLLGNFGKGKYMSDIEDAVYRKHSGSIWSKLDEVRQIHHNGVTRAWLYRYYKRIEQDEQANFFKEDLIYHFSVVLQKIASQYNPHYYEIIQAILTNYTDILDEESKNRLQGIISLSPYSGSINYKCVSDSVNFSNCKTGICTQKDRPMGKLVRCGGKIHLLKDLIRIDWIMTRRCNYKCSYCTVHDNENGFFPNIDKMKSTTDAIARLPNSNINIGLAGGEPTIHPDYIEFIDYLTETLKDRATVTTQTNLSLPLEFYKTLVSRLKRKHTQYIFNASYHFDHAEKSAFIERAKYLSDNGFSVVIKICAHPLYMNQVKSLYDNLSHLTSNFLKINIVIVRENFGIKPDTRYSEEDMDWFNSVYKNYESKPMFVDFMDDEKCSLIRKDYTPDEVIADSLNKYKGMFCNAGINSFSINANGDLDPAVCFRKVKQTKPNIYESSDAISKLPKGIICPFDACGVPSDQLIIKQTSDITERKDLKLISDNPGKDISKINSEIVLREDIQNIDKLKKVSNILSTSRSTTNNDMLTINWVLTRKCNYTCTYCTVKDNKNGFFHDIEALKSSIDKISLIKKDYIKFIITGGEPTICPNYIDFLEYIFHKLGTRATVVTITNLSMPLSYFENVRTSLHQYLEKISFIASFHFEHADKEQFIEKVNFISQNGIFIKTQILAHPEYMNVTRKLFDQLNQISNDKLKIDVKIVRENFGPNPDNRYSNEDLEWLKIFYKESENDEISVTFLSDNHKIDNLRLSGNELIAHGLNSFEGFECYAGIESISINANGEIDPAVCFRGTNSNKSNIFADENPIVSFQKPILCPFIRCACLADLLLTKRHPDYDNLVKSSSTSADTSLEYWLNQKEWQDKKELYSDCFESVIFQKDVNKPAISIIVISWRLHHDNLKSFQILEKQRDKNYELLFVDNGGKKGEFDPLKPFIDTYVKLNKNTGAYLARNIGAIFAKAPILLFLEDDGIPENNLIEAHLSLFDEYEIIACRGVYTPKTDNPMNKHQGHYYISNKEYPTFAHVEGNTSYLAETFFKAGGWDDEIEFGGGGLELYFRLLEVDPDKRKQIYSPRPVIYHDYVKDETHLNNKLERQKKSFERLRGKYPQWDEVHNNYRINCDRDDLLIKKNYAKYRQSPQSNIKRVLFVNHNIYPLELSGTPLSTRNHALGMVKLGLETAVLIPNPDIKNNFIKNLTPDGFTLYQVPALDKFVAYFAEPGLRDQTEYRKSISQIIDDFRPQVVHINDYVYMPAEIIELFSDKGCLVVRNVCNCEELCHQNYPVLSSGLDGYLCSGPESPDKCYDCFKSLPATVAGITVTPDLLNSAAQNVKCRFEYIQRLYNKNVDQVIFTSEAFREYFTKFVPISSEKVKVIPRGFDFDFPRITERRKDNDGIIHFAFIGNIMFSKGIDVALHAFERICVDYSFVLDIYGEIVNQEYQDWLNRLESKHPNQFIYHGKFDNKNLPEIASNIDVCIIPSYFDTYNRVLREFIYLEKPVIVTDFFGAYIVDDGKNGFRIPVGGTDTLAKKMIDIIQDPNIINNLSHGAAQTHIPTLNEEIDALVDTYNRLYNQSPESKKAILEHREDTTSEESPRMIAFYLPQYHPIPENDEWWGKGFTEWINVAKAKPLFPGHYQPHLPADLGFYDLRLPEVREAQAKMARQYGISGFCYYHYWFHGKRLLNRVLDEVIVSGKPDFPFCLCWANENWTSAWDGGDNKIIMEQRYSNEDDLAHIQWLIRAFMDPRYIKIQGRPLLLIYRASNLPDPKNTAALWREEVKKAGFPDLYLCKVESFANEQNAPTYSGFDASVEFQPDWSNLGDKKAGYQDLYVYDYNEIVNQMIKKPSTEYLRFPCVTPSWDNSPRRGRDGCIFHNSDPYLYEKWLRHALSLIDSNTPEEKIVFINAWNEWGEGNYLEPDQKNGHAYLHATRRAVTIDNVKARLNEQLTDDAAIALEFGRLDEARELLLKALSQDDSAPKTIHQLALLFFHEGNLPGSHDLLLRALEIDPWNAELHNDLGAIYHAGQEISKARSHFEKAMEINPKDNTAHKNLIELLINEDKFDDARDICMRLKSLAPDDEETDLLWNKINNKYEAEASGRPTLVDDSSAEEFHVKTTQNIAVDWTPAFDYQTLTAEEIEEYSNIEVTEDLREGGIHAQKAWEYWFKYLTTDIWKTSLHSEIVSFCNTIYRPRILSLGCGYGGVELEIARHLNKPYKITAVDLNGHLFTKARKEAEENAFDIRFTALDLNFVNIHENSFDLIFAHASLHHLLNLEHVFMQIYRGLKENGRLIVQDIIGKTQVLFWKDNVDQAIEIVNKMPSQYKKGIPNNHAIIAPYVNPSDQKGMEGIRQEEIPEMLESFFTPIKVFSYGSFMRLICTHPVLGNNFDPDKHQDREYLEHIFKMDLDLIEQKTLRPTEMLGVYQKHSTIDIDSILAKGRDKLSELLRRNGSSIEEQPRAGLEVHNENKIHSSPILSIILTASSDINRDKHNIQIILDDISNYYIELIIVGNCSFDKTRDYLSKLSHRNLNVIFPDSGITAVEGAILGANKASGRFLMFLDDSVTLTKLFLHNIIINIEGVAEWGALVGKTVSKDKIILEAGATSINETNLQSRGEGHPIYDPAYNFTCEMESGSRFCMVTDRDVWERVEGFNNKLEDIGAALIEIGMKIKLSGYTIKYQPQCILLADGPNTQHSKGEDISAPDPEILSSLRPKDLPLDLINSIIKTERRNVLVLGIYLANQMNNIEDIVSVLHQSNTYTVSQKWVALNGSPPDLKTEEVTVKILNGRVPKFQIINELIHEEDISLYDYIILCDDDVVLPKNFIDSFIAMQSSLKFAIAQPARTMNSYIDHPIVEQHIGVHARETYFVEIGPVTSFHQSTFDFIFPFDMTSPMGWGYENVWAYEAIQRDLKMGIIDGVCVDHSLRKPVANYGWDQADMERSEYLNKHNHLPLEECFRVVNAYIISEEKI